MAILGGPLDRQGFSAGIGMAVPAGIVSGGQPVSMSTTRDPEGVFAQAFNRIMGTRNYRNPVIDPTRAAAVAAQLATGTQRPFLPPNDPAAHDPLRAEIMRQQGWDAQRAQEGQFQQQARADAQKAMSANVLADDLTSARNIYQTLLTTPGVPPEMIEEAKATVGSAANRLYSELGLLDESAAQGGDSAPVAPPRSLREITEEVNDRIRRQGREPQERRQASPRLREILSDPAAARMLLEMRNR